MLNSVESEVDPTILFLSLLEKRPKAVLGDTGPLFKDATLSSSSLLEPEDTLNLRDASGGSSGIVFVDAVELFSQFF